MTQRDDAFNAIRELILSGEVPLGETLSERRLTDEFLGTGRFGRTPIREALAVLSLRGIVRQFPQVGFDVPRIKYGEAKRMIQISQAMERVIMGEIPKPLPARELSQLGSAADRMKRAMKDNYPTEFMAVNRDFHIALAELADYGSEAENIGSFYDRLQLYFRSSDQPLTEIEMDQFCERYERLIEAFETSDDQPVVNAFEAIAMLESELIEERIAEHSDVERRPIAAAASL